MNNSEKKLDSYTIELLDKENKVEDDKQKKGEKEETILEKEILTGIEECNKYFSLFDFLKENREKDNNSNNPEENDEIIFKNLLLNYQNGEILKLYLNMINNDNEEYENSIKSLID